MNSGEKGLPGGPASNKPKEHPKDGLGLTSGPKIVSPYRFFETNIVYYTMTKASREVLCFFRGKGEIKVDGCPFWFCQVLLACKSYRRFSTWCVVAYANTQVRIVTFTGLWLCSPFLGIQKETLWMCGKITSATELWLAVTGCDAGCQVTQLKYTKFVHEAISWALAVSCGSWPTSERPPLAITTITKGIPCGPYLVQPWMTSNHQDALYIMLSTSSIP